MTPLPLPLAQRFPSPEFASGYTLPSLVTTWPRPDWLEWADAAVLLAALTTAAWLVLKARSRRGVKLLALFSLLYFGFWRKGCVCPVGSVQNVAAALFAGAVLPATVLFFFLLPVVFALLFGRVFCAAICPLGAVQDLFIFKPVRMPAAVAHALGLVAYLYFGFAVLFAACGAGFIVCRLDPFVGFFRLGDTVPMLAVGAALLALGAVVARPYCRFVCPYGALLRLASALAWRHMTIAPDECVQCGLCENSCPFGYILKPTPEKTPEPARAGSRRLAILLGCAVVLAATGGAAGWLLHRPLARAHHTVRLADRLLYSTVGNDVEAFKSRGENERALLENTRSVVRQFEIGGIVLGCFVGIVLGAKLVSLSVWRILPAYQPSRALCLSCARCIEFCPQERVRRNPKREPEARGN